MADVHEMEVGILRSLLDQKARFRARFLELRKTAPFDREGASREVVWNLESVPEFRDANVLFLYSGKAATSEVLTGELLAGVLAQGKRAFLPRTLRESRELLFGEVVDYPGDLELGAFGVLEPKGRCFRGTPPPPDCIVVPGVAFDLEGNRLGYGQGYYDKFLGPFKGNTPIVALAYDFQVVTRVPAGPDDIAVDLVVTERRVLRF
ncbi:MAG: 5-formyltetrahydrofolate cyclo-ligase [Promethearchaeota archaeon]